ncbi:MAG: Wzz/FepE/Etk N-terminal domain-containing protein [Trebonia sp.]
MSQQALDFQRSFRIVRRHFRIFWSFVVLGLLIGVGYAVVKPPTLSGTALVVLPQVATRAAAAEAATGVASSDVIDTQVLIADSDPVLSAALPNVSPPMPVQTLKKTVHVTSLAGSVVSITATGSTADQAETTANAVADSYIAYVTGPSSPVGRVEAKVLESASNATGPTLLTRIAIDGGLGIVGGVIVGFVIALAVGRRDRRVSERDRMANSIGLPVLGSFPVAHPSDAAGWEGLLAGYQPDAVHAQRWRAMLKQLGVTDAARSDSDRGGTVASVTVLSFRSDGAALAVGPALASFAASEGIPTVLAIDPQQDGRAVEALRSAGTETPVPAQKSRLRVVVSDDGDASAPAADGLLVVVAVADASASRLPRAADTAAAVLAISPGAVTPRQLASAASKATVGGRAVLGIVVANPVPDDQTTGRNPRPGQPIFRPQPTRV